MSTSINFSIKPILTIGVPVYNGEHTLEETLESCAKLPVDLVRVIVSDNSSKDRSYDIMQTYAERCPHIIVHRHEQNLGATKNFKYLLDSCRTEYFMWLAADDVIADTINLVEVQKLFQKYPRAIAVSPFAMVGKMGAQVPDSGNQSLIGSRTENTLQFLLRPGVNSRFYSIYRTERLCSLFSSFFADDNGNYFASDIVFSVAVIKEGEWPLSPSFVLLRKPGISSDGWSLRKVFAKGWFDIFFPSPKFIWEIVSMSSPYEKPTSLLVTALLYLRYLIGPIRHETKTVIQNLLHSSKN